MVGVSFVVSHEWRLRHEALVQIKDGMDKRVVIGRHDTRHGYGMA
jgi:hypothetical protein